MLTPITQAQSPLTRPKCPGSYTYDASPYHYDVSDLNPAKQALRHPIREQFEPLASPTYTYSETQNALAQSEEVGFSSSGDNYEGTCGLYAIQKIYEYILKRDGLKGGVPSFEDLLKFSEKELSNFAIGKGGGLSGTEVKDIFNALMASKGMNYEMVYPLTTTISDIKSYAGNDYPMIFGSSKMGSQMHWMGVTPKQVGNIQGLLIHDTNTLQDGTYKAEAPGRVMRAGYLDSRSDGTSDLLMYVKPITN